jgi:hypothetical protein
MTATMNVLAPSRTRIVRRGNGGSKADNLPVRRLSARTLPDHPRPRNGQEVALVYQFGGGSKSGLPSGGEWKCLWLSRVHDVRLRDGPWHSGSSHARRQTCVQIVDIDINPASPYGPKRRL